MDLSLKKLPWYGQLGAFVAASGLAVGAFYSLYVGPVQADLEARRGQLAALRADIQKGQMAARQVAELDTQIATLEQRLDDLSAVLPEQKDVADLLRRIQTLATQSNLTIKGFKPQPIATREMHAEWPITLELDGTYHNLGRFFDQISKFSRIINISKLSIRPHQEPEGSATISAQCTATTFVLIETPAAEPGAAPTEQARAGQ